MAFGTFSQHISPSDGGTDCKDPTGLGRWCSLVSKCGAKKTRFVVAYRPCVPSALRRRGAQRSGNEHRRMKVWEQQSRYFRGRGVLVDPDLLFDRDLLIQLRTWRANNEEVVLMGDFNQSVYTSDFAKLLGEEDIQLTEQYRKLYDKEAPFSHVSSQLSICGVFATP